MKSQKLLILGPFLLIMACDPLSFEENDQDRVRIIKQHFESNLYTLSPKIQGHYGLRMYRQTQNPKYLNTVRLQLFRISDALLKQAELLTSKQAVIDEGMKQREKYGYVADSIRRKLRYRSTKGKEEYLVLAYKIIAPLTRVNEFGLVHNKEQQLRERLREFDFADYALDPDMIRARAAQLANQVYGLKQIGEQDLTTEFIRAFRKIYPDTEDASLNRFQYQNKIYGLTHIIIAASEYYRKPINEEEFQWIFDYYRKNIDNILSRTKPDIIAEVGINFLLAGLEGDSVVQKTRAAIRASIDPKTGIIPPEKGGYKLSKDEHRNVISVMLLDWQGANPVPDFSGNEKDLLTLPYGFSPRN